MPHTISFSFPSLVIALVLTGCLGGKEDGPAGPVSEKKINGRIVAQDGNPAPGAKVRIFPVTHLPQETLAKSSQAAGPVYVGTTDDAGRYVIDSLAAGEYNILAEKDGQRSFEDSVAINPGSQLPSDTLKSTGTIEGMVELEPNHDPSTVTLQLLGTHIYANADKQGRFRFPDLAEGRYSLKASTTLGEYTALYDGFSVQAGKDDSLAEALKPRFTGIPVVRGLRLVKYDTANGVASLAWSKPDFTNLLGFGIFRDPKGASVLSSLPLNPNRVTDTIYQDTLFGGPLDSASTTRHVEYRVRVQDRNTRFGEAFHLVEVAAIPPRQVRTFLSMDAIGAENGKVYMGDTLRIVGRFGNATRKVTKLEWRQKGEAAPMKALTPSALAGQDTLVFPPDSVPRARDITFQSEDEGGAPMAVQMSILRLPTRKVAGLPDAVALGDDGGDNPNPNAVSTGGKIYLYFKNQFFEYDISRNEWARKPSPQSINMPLAALAAVNGKVYAFGGTNIRDSYANPRIEAYDPQTGVWSFKTPMTVPVPFRAAFIYKGRILAVTCSRYSSIQDQATALAFGEYDPEADKWTSRPPIARKPVGEFHAWNDRIFCFNKAGTTLYIEEFEPDSNRFTAIVQVLDVEKRFGARPGFAVADGKLYVMGGDLHREYNGGVGGVSAHVEAYSLADGKWEEKFPMLFPRGDAYTVVADGKIFVMGGNTDPYSGNKTGAVETYFPH